MSQNLELYWRCPQCFGSGIFIPAGGENPSFPCNWPGCNATGYILYGKMPLEFGLNDIFDKCNDIIDKCDDILEKLNE